jgi:hypothetical protein
MSLWVEPELQGIEGSDPPFFRLPYQNRRCVTKLGARFHHAAEKHRMPGNRNVLYLVIGVLIVAVGVLGFNLYKAKQEPDGLQINVGPNGLKIQSK